MAELRELPYPGCHFLVKIGAGNAGLINAGFSEVIFPPLLIDADAAIGAVHAANQRLVLKRGVNGDLSLYTWWHRTRSARPTRPTRPTRSTRARTVEVQLLNEAHSAVVLTWRFRNARPYSLTYSPLRAMANELVMETLELSFDGVELR